MRFPNIRVKSKSGTGFTLIELLVVICIIAILAAILFPVFLTVKATSRSASCLSNLRQIGMAVRTYADDYGGVMPDCLKIGDAFTSASEAFDVLAPRKLHMKVQPYSKSRAIFRDPADLARYTWNGVDGRLDATYYDAFGSSYQTYGDLDTKQKDWDPVKDRLASDLYGYKWPVNMSVLVHPSKIRIVRDAIPYHIKRDSRGTYWKWNELCADGHAFTYKSSEERGGNADRGTSADTGGII